MAMLKNVEIVEGPQKLEISKSLIAAPELKGRNPIRAEKRSSKMHVEGKWVMHAAII